MTLDGPALGALVDAVSQGSVAPQNNNDVPALSTAIWVGEAHDWSGLYAVVALGRGGTAIQLLMKPETSNPGDFGVSYETCAELAADLDWAL